MHTLDLESRVKGCVSMGVRDAGGMSRDGVGRMRYCSLSIEAPTASTTIDRG